MKRIVVPAAVVAILAVLLWLARTSDRTAALAPTGAALAAPKQTPDVVAPAPERDSARVSAPTSIAEAPADGDAPKTAAAPELAELRGRFLLPGGAPAAGVRLELHGFEANDERVQQFGMPKDWQDLETATGSDGAFVFRFDPPRAFQFFVDATRSGYAKVSWRWSALPPKEVTDVGEVMLVRGGTIRGRLVDRAGRVPAGEWQVYCETGYQPRGAGADQTRLYAPLAPDTGEFRFDDVPPGSARLKAYSRIANWIQGPTVEVREGGTSEAKIVYVGPDNSRRITVAVLCRPFYVFQRIKEGTLKLRGPGGIERTAAKIEGSAHSWSFDDLPPGSYSIEIDDPRFEPLKLVGVEPGQSVEALLEGASAVRLAVLDAVTNAPITAYRLRVQFRSGSAATEHPEPFEIVGADAPPPAGGLFTRMMPVDQTWIVDVPECAPCRVDIDRLAPGETRSTVARITRGASLEGVVADANGAPARGVAVLLRDKPRIGRGNALDVTGRNTSDSLRTSTDDAGRFSFRALAPQSYVLSATRNALIRAEAVVEVGAEAVTTRLSLPSSGSLVGRILGPEGASFSGWRVFAWPKDTQSPWPEEASAVAPRADVGADGAFRIDSVPPGIVVVYASHERVAFAIGEAQIVANQAVEASFDVRERFPGDLDVAVTIDGEALAGFWVVPQSAERWSEIEQANSGAQTDESGVAHLTWLRAGEWRLCVAPSGREWQYPASEPVRVRPAALARTAIAVNLVSGELVVLGADGASPLANRSVSIESSASHVRVSAMTDENGRVRFRVPEGRYRVLAGGANGGARAPGKSGPEIEWTRAGPVPASVAIP